MSWEDGKIITATVKSHLGGSCRVRSNVPLKVEDRSNNLPGRDSHNLLMQSSQPQSFVDNSTGKIDLDIAETFLIEFETEKGKQYTLVPDE